jgi:AAA15 family ATPase/GTPase
MNALHLDSLEIRNFRIFHNFEIKRLRQVNLVVGKNNTGKTTLLEALWIYARRSPYLLWSILESRDESHFYEESSVESRLSSLTSLFYGRPEFSLTIPHIQIGEMNSDISKIDLALVGLNESRLEYKNLVKMDSIDINGNGFIPGVALSVGNEYEVLYRLDKSMQFLRAVSPIPHMYVPAGGLKVEQIDNLWNHVFLTELEKDVISSLHLIEPQVDRIGMINSNPSGILRHPVVKLVSESAPVPLKSLGQGVFKIFEITLAMVNAKDGILLIDEVGSGLHYSVQIKFWQYLLKMAEKLSVQVFATTHSDDCVRAFQYASAENEKVEGQLIRLEKWDGKVTAILYDEEELTSSVEGEIEVR